MKIHPRVSRMYYDYKAQWSDGSQWDRRFSSACFFLEHLESRLLNDYFWDADEQARVEGEWERKQERNR